MRKATIIGLMLVLVLALFTAGCSGETATQVDDVTTTDSVDTTATDQVDSAAEPVIDGLIDESDEVEIGEMI